MTFKSPLDYAVALVLALLSVVTGPLTGLPALVLARGALNGAEGDETALTRAKVVSTYAIVGLVLFTLGLLVYLGLATSSKSVAPFVTSDF